MNRITVNKDGQCAAEKFCFQIRSNNEKKEKWIKEHDLFVSDTGRAYALVDTTSCVYFMDCVTGSLYQFGECISASALKIFGLRRDKEAARQYLLKK